VGQETFYVTPSCLLCTLLQQEVPKQTLLECTLLREYNLTSFSTSVVPFCSHVDHTEHDLDVFVTEQGFADLRGLAPRERAAVIIDKCAHPAYKPILKEYLDISTRKCLAAEMGHEPRILERSCYI
jgi:hypothetical protein